MPARMIINTENIVGYNNKLMQAQAGMKLGVNNDVNLGTKKISTPADGWGAIKNKSAKQPPFKPNLQSRHGCTITAKRKKVSEEKTVSTPLHEINKTAVIIGVVGIVALLFIASR